jgi:predicted esterase
MTPREQNEPALSSALAAVAGLLDRLNAAGIPASRTLVAGFSQGACLALEFVARNARRYGGVAGLSGGLIGSAPLGGGPDPRGRREAQGSLDGTPVLLACGEHDPHIPASRVMETASVLRGLGGLVTLRLDPVLGHTVDEKEIDSVRAMLAALMTE